MVDGSAVGPIPVSRTWLKARRRHQQRSLHYTEPPSWASVRREEGESILPCSAGSSVVVVLAYLNVVCARRRFATLENRFAYWRLEYQITIQLQRRIVLLMTSEDKVISFVAR